MLGALNPVSSVKALHPGRHFYSSLVFQLSFQHHKPFTDKGKKVKERAATINRKNTRVWINWKQAIQKDPDTPTSATQLQILGIFTVQLNHPKQLSVSSHYTLWSMLDSVGTIKAHSFFPQWTWISKALKYVCTISSLFILQIFALVRRLTKTQIQKFKYHFSLFVFIFHFHIALLVHPWEASGSSPPQMAKTQSPPDHSSTNYFCWKNCCVFCQEKVCVGPDGNRSQNYETSA